MRGLEVIWQFWMVLSFGNLHLAIQWSVQFDIRSLVIMRVSMTVSVINK